MAINKKKKPLFKLYNYLYKDHRRCIKEVKTFIKNYDANPNVNIKYLFRTSTKSRSISRLSMLLLNQVHLTVDYNHCNSMRNMKPNDDIGDLSLYYTINDKTFVISINYKIVMYEFYKNNDIFFEDGILYQPGDFMSRELHNSFEWDKVYEDDELFQQSLIHDYDIPFLQEVYRLSQKLMIPFSTGKISVLDIYKVLSS